MILHITKMTDWESAKKQGEYRAPSLDAAGFIHCSLAEQVVRVADFNFKGQSGLALLEIDEARVKAEVKYEDLGNEGQLFPHIYGPLNLDAVERVHLFPCGADGRFALPVSLG
jgi:uncharacterized protein (DUF952 family)